MSAVCPRALRQQQRHHLGIARTSGDHHRRFAEQERRVRIGASREQTPDHARASVQAGRPQRRHAKIVRRVHGSAGANQHIGGFKIIGVARPVQRRRAIGFGDVDVRFLAQQRAQCFAVGILDRVDHGEVATGSRGGAHQHQRGQAE
jgi:hypothetical protein